FRDAIGDPVAVRLYQAITKAGSEGLTFTQQNRAFGGNESAERIAIARQALTERDLVQTITLASTGGRPRQVTKVRSCNERTKETNKASTGGLTSFSSFFRTAIPASPDPSSDDKP